MKLIDTHCHLNDQAAFPDPVSAIHEAVEAGVTRMVVIGVDLESSRIAVNLAEKFDEVYAVVGCHPSYSQNYLHADLKRYEEMMGHPKVVAMGEIGLDYHWDYATRSQQYGALMDQLDLGISLKKPMVFHCREAYSDVLDILEAKGRHDYLLHCFAGNDEEAERALALGCLFGVDGPVTYKKAEGLRETLAKIGIANLVLETDAPWLAPHPLRGKPNRPALLGLIRDALAAALGLSPERVSDQTTTNAERFFRLPANLG